MTTVTAIINDHLLQGCFKTTDRIMAERSKVWQHFSKGDILEPCIYKTCSALVNVVGCLTTKLHQNSKHELHVELSNSIQK